MRHAVDLPVALPLLVRCLQAAARDDSRVREVDVDSPVLLFGLADELADARFAADVAGDRKSLHFIGNRLQAFRVQVGDDDAGCTFCSKSLRGSAADAARRAGDDADLALQVH